MDSLALFKKLKPTSEPYDEKEWGTVYSQLFEIPDAPYTTFIKLKYFRDCKGPIARFQDIPDTYKTFSNPVKLFVSHNWENHIHPDASRKTLNNLLGLTKNHDDEAAIWLDYCCLPQKDPITGMDDRSEMLKEFFEFQLTLIPVVILDSQCMFLWSEKGSRRGWCCIELLIAKVLMEHLNKMVYARKDSFLKPPLFATLIGNRVSVETDLWRFDHRMVDKIYANEIVMKRHQDLIIWMNIQINKGAPTPYSQLVKKVTPELITKMISEHGLAFTNPSDAKAMPRILGKIYQQLSLDPFENFKWTGQKDLFSMWHYVKGSLGNCLVPTVDYRF